MCAWPRAKEVVWSAVVPKSETRALIATNGTLLVVNPKERRVLFSIQSNLPPLLGFGQQLAVACSAETQLAVVRVGYHYPTKYISTGVPVRHVCVTGKLSADARGRTEATVVVVGQNEHGHEFLMRWLLTLEPNGTLGYDPLTMSSIELPRGFGCVSLAPRNGAVALTTDRNTVHLYRPSDLRSATAMRLRCDSTDDMPAKKKHASPLP